MAEYEQSIPNAKTFSFDIFDTLLLRQVAHPIDVFLPLERHSSFRPHLFPIPINGIAELRVKAEDQARQRLFKERGTGEVTLAEIYAEFCGMVRLPPSEAAGFVAAEEDTELLLVRSNPRIMPLFESAMATGKRVIAVSDTYHHKDFLLKLLAGVGITIQPGNLFVSSDLRINKQSGALWRHILEVAGVPAGLILHVGDHPVSDHAVPRKMGIKTLLHEHCVTGAKPRLPFHSREAAGTQSYVRAAIAFQSRCSTGEKEFWWRVGHNVFGPLVTGFCQWLEKGFAVDRIDRAYFLLRDGEIFSRVYEALFPEASVKPRLLQASRRAYVFPLLESAPEFVLRNLFVGIGARPVGEYLARLGVSPNDFSKEFNAAGFESVEQQVDGRLHADKLRKLAHMPAVRTALEIAAKEEKDALTGYLRQEEMLKSGRVAIVDLGWNGTIQKALQQMLAQQSVKPDFLSGYYLATYPTFRTAMPLPNLVAKSYLLHFGEPRSIAGVFQSADVLVEAACSSAAGSLLRFREVGGHAAPVLLSNPHDSSQLLWLSEIHEGVVAFARFYREQKSKLSLVDLPAPVAAEELLRLQTNPTKEEAVEFGRFSQCDDFGSVTRQRLAQFRDDACSPEQIWEDYQRAAWKAGMLNQPSPQCATLRSLLWLMQP